MDADLKDKKTIALLAMGIVAALAAVISLFFMQAKEVDSSEAIVCFEKACLKAKIADNAQSRARGLMHRERLGKKEGMFFIFESEGFYSFWMKDTFIPLDIIWLDSSLRVVHVESAQPCKTEECPLRKPGIPAKYALEANQGFAEKNEISIGDTASVNY